MQGSSIELDTTTAGESRIGQSSKKWALVKHLLDRHGQKDTLSALPDDEVGIGHLNKLHRLEHEGHGFIPST